MPPRFLVALLIPAAAVFAVAALAQNPTAVPSPSGIRSTPGGTSASDTASARRTSTDTTTGALTLTGTVTDASGAAIGAAVVALIGTDDSTSTDDRGRFVLHGPRAGAYMLGVRRLGFAPQRQTVSLSTEHAAHVVVTMTHVVPVLPTITTTADERRAYRDVGFDGRSAGVGQFLTYEQIVRRQATAAGDLLKGLLGIVAKMTPTGEWMISSARSGCVSYMLDGQSLSAVDGYVVAGSPGQPLRPGQRAYTAFGAASPDEFIDAHDVGAIEYYESSERPAQFGSNGCALVVVWTRTRLGLPERAAIPDKTASGDAPVIRGVPVLESDASCTLPASSDTGDFPIYAALAGVPSRPVDKKLWTAYTDSALSVIRRWSVLPTDLRLPTFGPSYTRRPDDTETNETPRDSEVAPTISSVLAFTLDSSGTLSGAHVAASALSGSVDTSMLAGLERAAEAHAFPTFPGGASGGGSVRFDLFISSVEPETDTEIPVLGWLEVPVWPLALGAYQLADYPVAMSERRTADGVKVQVVVDAHGRAVSGTVRILKGPARDDDDALDSGFRQRLAQRLKQMRFEPAQIGSCPVPQLVTQSIMVPAGAANSQ